MPLNYGITARRVSGGATTSDEELKGTDSIAYAMGCDLRMADPGGFEPPSRTPQARILSIRRRVEVQAAVTRARGTSGGQTWNRTRTASLQGRHASVDTTCPDWSAWRDFNPRSLPWQGSVFSTRPHAQRIAPSPRREGVCTDSAPLSKSPSLPAMSERSESNWCTGLDSNQDLSGFN